MITAMIHLPDFRDFLIMVMVVTFTFPSFAEERALALRVMRLPEVLTQLEDDLLPSRLIEPYVSGVDEVLWRDHKRPQGTTMEYIIINRY